MAAGDLHRNRGVRNRRVRAHRAGGPPDATRACRDRESARPRRPLCRVLADPRGGRRLGVGAPPRAVPDRAADGVRVHWWTGGTTPRRAADEGAVPAHRDRILGGVSPRRPPRYPPPRAPRVDREPAAGHDGRATRVPRPPARDGAAVPGGTRGARPGVPGRRPAIVTRAVRVRPRPPPARLPGAVRDGLAVAGLPPLQPCAGAVQR